VEELFNRSECLQLFFEPLLLSYCKNGQCIGRQILPGGLNYVRDSWGFFVTPAGRWSGWLVSDRCRERQLSVFPLSAAVVPALQTSAAIRPFELRLSPVAGPARDCWKPVGNMNGMGQTLADHQLPVEP